MVGSGERLGAAILKDAESRYGNSALPSDGKVKKILKFSGLPLLVNAKWDFQIAY